MRKSFNTKKFCSLVMIMLLGISSVTAQDVIISDETRSQEELADIKVNKDTLEKAEELIKAKEFALAIKYLSSYITDKPNKYEPYRLRGEAYYALRQYKQAKKDFEKAIELKTNDDKFGTGVKVLSAVVLGADKLEQYQNPDLGKLYGNLMYAQKALNDQNYETSYYKATELNSHIYLPKPKKEEVAKINCPQKYGKVFNPTGIDLDIYGAIDDIENKDYRNAVFKIQNITSEYPNYYLGYYLSGVAMSGMERKDDAIYAFEKAFQLNPNDFESIASLAHLYYVEAEKNFDKTSAQKSIEYFNKALKLNPSCYIYYYYIALNYLQMGEYKLAVLNFNNAIRLKSKDYNSMYYKAIAQYLLGDYQSTIDVTTNLIFSRVSNYNSVMYLRALAYNQLGQYSEALTDIEQINNSISDVYNSDIKPLSDKEKTLSNYLYYLKAQILNQNGLGTKSDLAKSYENPIIKSLALSDESVVPEILLTYEDIENQYDYIRTAFASRNISFKYSDNNYKMISMETMSEVEDLSAVVLKKSTDPLETLNVDNSVSMAQMLASQSLNPVLYFSEVSPQEKAPIMIEEKAEEHIITEPVKKTENTILFEAQEKKETETFEIKYHNSETVEKIVQTSDDKVEEGIIDAVEKVSKLKDEIEENIEPPIENKKIEEVANNIIDSTEEVSDKISEDVTEITEEKTTNEISEKTIENNEKVIIKSSAEEVVTEKIEEVADYVSEIQSQVMNDAIIEDKNQSSKIAEKHAQVNINEFNIQKQMPEIKEDDEIIIFQPTRLLQAHEQRIASESISRFNNPNNITDNFANSENKSIVKAIETPSQKLVSESPVVVSEQETNVSEIDEETLPIAGKITTPEIIIPEITALNTTSKTLDNEHINKDLQEVSDDVVNEVVEEISEENLAQNIEESVEEITNPVSVEENTNELEIVTNEVSTISDEKNEIVAVKNNAKKEKRKKNKIKKQEQIATPKIPVEENSTQEPVIEIEPVEETFVGSLIQSMFNTENKNKESEETGVSKIEEQKINSVEKEQEIEQQVQSEILNDAETQVSSVVNEVKSSEDLQIQQKRKWWQIFKRDKKKEITENNLIDKKQSDEILENQSLSEQTQEQNSQLIKDLDMKLNQDKESVETEQPDNSSLDKKSGIQNNEKLAMAEQDMKSDFQKLDYFDDESSSNWFAKKAKKFNDKVKVNANFGISSYIAKMFEDESVQESDNVNKKVYEKKVIKQIDR